MMARSQKGFTSRPDICLHPNFDQPRVTLSLPYGRSPYKRRLSRPINQLTGPSPLVSREHALHHDNRLVVLRDGSSTEFAHSLGELRAERFC